MIEILFDKTHIGSLLLFYVTVIAISALYSMILVFFLKGFDRKKKILFLLFFILIDIVTLFLGLITTTILTIYLVRFKEKKYIKNIDRIDYEEFKVEFKNIKRIFGEGSLSQMMSDENIPDSLKLKALGALSINNSKENVAILKTSLADSADEVRLYSFALIDSLEKEINQKIKLGISLLNKKTANKEKIEIYIAILNQYWELIYFGLSDKSMELFVISKIKHYAKLALKISTKSSIIYIILGKAFMFEKNWEYAHKSFVKAIKNGANSNFIRPYLAEIAFNQRKFLNVSRIMKDAKGLESNNNLQPMVVLWQNDKNVA